MPILPSGSDIESAIEQNNIKSAEQMLHLWVEAGKNLDEFDLRGFVGKRDKDNNTILHYAAAENHIELINLCVRQFKPGQCLILGWRNNLGLTPLKLDKNKKIKDRTLEELNYGVNPKSPLSSGMGGGKQSSPYAFKM